MRWLLLSVLCGCATTASTGVRVASCTSDPDCPGGMVCIAGTCRGKDGRSAQDIEEGNRPPPLPPGPSGPPR